MKILYFSDIHLEIWEDMTQIRSHYDLDWEYTYPLSLGPFIVKEPDVDVCVLAGDIGLLVSQTANPIKYCEQLSKRLGNKPVIFVPGNHEYYKCHDFYGMKQSLEKNSIENVHILNNSSVIIDGVRFIGSTLWTDYCLFGKDFQQDCMKAAEQYMADHRGAIRKVGINGGKKNFTTHDALKEFQDAERFINNELTNNDSQTTIIVTHHVPLVSSETINPQFQLNVTASGFMSHKPGMFALAADKGVKAWIFGHHHHCLQSEAFGVKLLSNQVGYPNENTNWTTHKILEI